MQFTYCVCSMYLYSTCSCNCASFVCLCSQMVHNVDRVRDHEVGSEFMKYIRRQSKRREELDDYLFVEFDPEAV